MRSVYSISDDGVSCSSPRWRTGGDDLSKPLASMLLAWWTWIATFLLTYVMDLLDIRNSSVGFVFQLFQEFGTIGCRLVVFDGAVASTDSVAIGLEAMLLRASVQIKFGEVLPKVVGTFVPVVHIGHDVCASIGGLKAKNNLSRR